MRLLLLLLFGAFGALLLFFARSQYNKAAAQLSQMTVLEGLVGAPHPDTGNYSVTYQIGSSSYEIWLSQPPGGPKLRPGGRVTIVCPPGKPAEGRLKHWSNFYTDSMVLAGFGILGLLIAAGSFLATGGHPPPALGVASSVSVATLAAPIELRQPRDKMVMMFIVAAVLFFATYFLVRDPSLLWTRWLSYPVALFVALFGIGLIFSALSLPGHRIVADANGIEVRSGSNARRFGWHQIAALRDRRYYKTVSSQGQHRPTKESRGRSFVLLDKAGSDILELTEDLVPEEERARLIGYIPARTGLPVQAEEKALIF